MKVLLLNYEFPPIGGGAATATLNLLREFSKRNDVEVDLITSSVDKERQEQFSENIKIYFLDIEKNGRLHNQSNADLLKYSWKAWRLARKLRKEKKYDLIHSFFGIPCGFVAMLLGMSYVVSLRGSDVPFYSEKYKLLDTLLFQRLSRRIWKKADVVIANSEGLKKLALKSSPKQEIGVIYNGVDTEIFAPSQKKPEEFTIISTSRLEKRKGLEFLVEGFGKFNKQYKDSRLILIGGGDQENKLRKISHDLGAESVVDFVGVLDLGELSKWYKKVDVFSLPSFNEGMSNSLLEAIASGLAIVATDTGGTKELINDSNGIIVEKGSSEDVFRAFEKLYTDRQLLESMKEKSREKALVMSWINMSNQYLEVYKKV
ncbi:MAG: glycosyltransferase [Patescibacteria group bacterium]|nr:glycosyltransferase [Patescibacteria group bacterium]